MVTNRRCPNRRQPTKRQQCPSSFCPNWPLGWPLARRPPRTRLADAAESAVRVDDPEGLERPVHGLLLGRHVAHHRRRQAPHQPNQEPAHARADHGRRRGTGGGRGGDVPHNPGKQPCQGPGWGATSQQELEGRHRKMRAGHQNEVGKSTSPHRFKTIVVFGAYCQEPRSLRVYCGGAVIRIKGTRAVGLDAVIKYRRTGWAEFSDIEQRAR